MTDDPVWAYGGPRAGARGTTKDEKRHAVTWTSKMGGAMDAECGVIATLEVGYWDPADPLNCPRCVAYLNGEVPIPEELDALTAASPLGVPSMFEAAA